jgi:hypothetical protein
VPWALPPPPRRSHRRRCLCDGEARACTSDRSPECARESSHLKFNTIALLNTHNAHTSLLEVTVFVKHGPHEPCLRACEGAKMHGNSRYCATVSPAPHSLFAHVLVSSRA